MFCSLKGALIYICRNGVNQTIGICIMVRAFALQHDQMMCLEVPILLKVHGLVVKSKDH